MTIDTNPTTLVLGAGPAGLTAGFLLGKAGRDVLVLEGEDQVGGLARRSRSTATGSISAATGSSPSRSRSRRSGTRSSATSSCFGPACRASTRTAGISTTRCRFQRCPRAGPRRAGQLHRRISRRDEVAQARRDVRGLGDEPVRQRVFEIFFKSYTEKLWGMPTSEISADWAAQRIQGLTWSRRWQRSFGQQGQGQDPDRRVPVSPRSVPARCGKRLTAHPRRAARCTSIAGR